MRKIADKNVSLDLQVLRFPFLLSGTKMGTLGDYHGYEGNPEGIVCGDLGGVT
ncbi:MAG: hypothetical protein ACLS22_01650 [Blautia wexlerae]